MVILCRYGELTLKGNNRSLFEKKLQQNIRHACRGYVFEMRKAQARLIITTTAATEQKLLQILPRIFGLSSVSQALAADEDTLYPAIDQTILDRKFSTFRITAQRLVKKGKTSEELQRELGRYVVEKYGKKVSLQQFDLQICLEVIDACYLFTEYITCAGGLPLGIEGTVLAYLQDESDIKAAWLLMKRGCAVVPVAQKHRDIKLLADYYNPHPLIVIKDTAEIQHLIQQHKICATVQGTVKPIPCSLPVLRPLVS